MASSTYPTITSDNFYTRHPTMSQWSTGSYSKITIIACSPSSIETTIPYHCTNGWACQRAINQDLKVESTSSACLLPCLCLPNSIRTILYTTSWDFKVDSSSSVCILSWWYLSTTITSTSQMSTSNISSGQYRQDSSISCYLIDKAQYGHKILWSIITMLTQSSCSCGHSIQIIMAWCDWYS